MHGVLFTPVFEREVRQAGLSEDELMTIVAAIAADPTGGDLIVGTGGARKVRHAGRGHGKSGGYRTVHYFGGNDVPLFMLSLIDKGEKANLTNAERNELAAILPRIAAKYRERQR
jgi:hypothetical protein